MPVVPSDWLSLQEAADACGMAYRTMLAKVRRGGLSAEKPDGKPYRLDVDAFIERSRGSARPTRVRARQAIHSERPA